MVLDLGESDALAARSIIPPISRVLYRDLLPADAAGPGNQSSWSGVREAQ